MVHCKARGAIFPAAHGSLVVQVRQRRADDLAERASQGSMADTRSLDSAQSSKRGGQASKRSKVRGPRLETLRCGGAHSHRRKGWQVDKTQALLSLGAISGVAQPPHDLPCRRAVERAERRRRRRPTWRASGSVHPAHGQHMTACRGLAWPCLAGCLDTLLPFVGAGWQWPQVQAGEPLVRCSTHEACCCRACGWCVQT